MQETANRAKHLWIAYILLNFTLGITKISIVLSYLRLFASQRWTRIACIAFLCVLIANTIISVTCCILTCHPIGLFWHLELVTSPQVLTDNCVNFKAMWYTQGYIYVLFDVILILLPIPVVKCLRISRREKVALASIFALGGL